jgi:glycine cleavage system protein P-like pyridoxal-binding family
MADKLPEVRDHKLTDVLKRLDADLNEPTKYAPRVVRETLSVQPSESLLGATDSTAENITSALQEIDTKSAALHENADKVIKQLKAWMNEFATQHAQLLQEMNELQGRLNESVERIVEIGKKPVGGNSKGE